MAEHSNQFCVKIVFSRELYVTNKLPDSIEDYKNSTGTLVITNIHVTARLQQQSWQNAVYVCITFKIIGLLLIYSTDNTSTVMINLVDQSSTTVHADESESQLSRM